MKLNCKPGDLARIVSPYGDAELIDLYVTVIRAGCWSEEVDTRGGRIVAKCYAGKTTGVVWLCDANRQDFPRFINDCYLRPIRDPGDDAQDESLSWLPVPGREEVSA